MQAAMSRSTCSHVSLSLDGHLAFIYFSLGSQPFVIDLNLIRIHVCIPLGPANYVDSTGQSVALCAHHQL